MGWSTARKYFCVGILSLACATGCATKAQSGALGGAGVGALVGQLAGGTATSTLIGAGVGVGVGYIIGNEVDKSDAKNREVATEAEMVPFSGTTWQLLSVNPAPSNPARSVTAKFNKDGTVTTTRIYADGKTETATEKYRVVGDTLIVNQPDYIINAKFRIDGNKLYLNTSDRSAVFVRV